MDDDAIEAKVQQDLAHLSFLNAGTEAVHEMPVDVWSRLEATLASEARVATIGPKSRRKYWLSGLVAASVVIIASTAILQAGSQPPPEIQTLGALEDDVTLSNQSLPIRQVMASGTHYTRVGLQTQVGSLLTMIGATDPRSAGKITQEPPEVLTQAVAGFSSTLEGLQSCLTEIGSKGAQEPLVIDLSDLEGEPAGFIIGVAPNGSVNVWVVKMTCGETTGGTSTIMQTTFTR